MKERLAVADGAGSDSVPVFTSALEQVRAEFQWLSLRLRVVVERGRRRRAVGPAEEYRGLYIADEEVDDFLASGEPPLVDVGELIRQAADLRGALDRRGRASLAAGAALPLERVARVFGLSAPERQLLVIGLAPWLDVGYEKVYAYVNDDIARRWPTVALALEVLSDDPAEALRLRPLFYEDAALARHRLMRLGDEQGSSSASLLTRSLELDGHVAEVLLGYGGSDPRLHGVAQPAGQVGDESEAAEGLATVLRRRPNARIYLGGRWHDEKVDAAAGASARTGLKTIVVHTTALRARGRPVEATALLFRDARLLGASLYFDEWGGQGENEGETALPLASLQTLVDEHPLPLFFSGASATPDAVPARLDLRIELRPPDYATRRRAWSEGEDGARGEVDPGQLASTFRFGAREIRSALRMARSVADWRGAGAVQADDLKLAARLQSQPHLTALAQKIAAHFVWEDIVLPPDRIAQLREIAAQVLYQHVVYDEWGFATKTSLGRGVNALFAGPSGTGKTMAAEIIANELGLDMYKIDLSGLVSKYIGETEKNLARVFDEAGDSNAILFFDEADAVFGKRTEVRDSHDRYANIEVSYLLQKMEEYDGIVVMASNMRSNIDDAFLRRMRAIVEFPFPEEEDRLRIWRRMLTTSAPVAADVDLAFMARQFRIAGGNIKNIVLLAAFLAATAGAPIGMSHLIRATKREYQKMGRLITESDFAGWYEEARV